MYRTILAAVDGSQRSSGVVAVALEVAERFDAKVHLFRSVAVPPDFPAAAYNATPDTLPAFLEAEARKGLEELARSSPRLVVEPIEMETPQAWKAIIAAAARLDVDLIVVGSHGYLGWDHLLGTTAAKVTNRADRDVLVVHRSRPPLDASRKAQPSGQ